MQYYHVILFLLAIAIAMSAVAPKIKIPYPVLLMLVGIAVGFIPGFHYIPIDPDVVFLLFLPPLLYDAAVNIPFHDFKANFRTISMMAVTLVFVSMLAIAIVARLFIPDISWPIAFVIGAILSPPDAVAASGITRSLNLSHRTNTILEGESLINDASALTAYRIALGVATGGIFSFWDAGLEFITAIVGGCLIGGIMAYLFNYTLSKVKLESTAIVSLNLMLPFVAYQLAEELKVSGVLAVVFMGILIAGRVHKDKVFNDITKVQSKAVWSTLIFLLSGLVFILIGLEFPQVLADIPSKSVLPLVISSFVIFLIALGTRMLVIFRHKFKLDKIVSIINKGKYKEKVSAKRTEYLKRVKPLTWKDALIISWSGMRGIVSVATAIALPITLYNGEIFHQRNSVIFLTVLVVILMLVIQGLGLPLLIKWLKIDTDGSINEEKEDSIEKTV